MPIAPGHIAASRPRAPAFVPVPWPGYWPDRPADATATACQASICGVRRAAIRASIGAVSRGDAHAGGRLSPKEFVMSDRASSQSSPCIEQLAPELEKIISPSEPILHLAVGFAGAQGQPEGPLGRQQGSYPVF